jgi:hypothetical protein
VARDWNEDLLTTHALLQGVKVDRDTTQSIITGTPERQREQSVDLGKTVVTQSKYLELLKMAGNQHTGEPLVLVQCSSNLRQCRNNEASYPTSRPSTCPRARAPAARATRTSS